ncbi:hypothetical protein [Hufsiella ginkgonis]|uniref:Uncharacterized protein n=1 Tax=Hufsiella ginkgonis TaxID=2695274 RepID=A0A7K1Y1F1_9SPHI|nr:hypothetical protein [Hufsiella ginkgonis]MXV16849.1 hypothetical protein [Hufsiella ginkgonis]
MSPAKFTKIGRLLSIENPELATMLQNRIERLQPISEDLTKLPMIYQYCRGDKMIFMAVAVKVYDPESLILRSQYIKKGLRLELSKVLCSPKSCVSRMFGNVKVHMVAYKSFSDLVNETYSSICDQIQNKQ